MGRNAARVAVCLVLVMLGALASGSPASSTSVVAVKDDFFSPARITVGKGDRVTWHWRGDGAHNVVGNGWSSPRMKRGTYARTFRRVGTYAFVCALHRGMSGRVIVEP